MKTTIINTIKPILADRFVVALTFLFVLACLAYCAYVAVSLRPSDLQVAVHYTAFGETNFYREKWYYLINFIVLGILMAVIHTVLIVKLYLQGRRQITILFVWLSLLLVVVTWLITWAVLKIAFL
jgi:hypothetical protein